MALCGNCGNDPITGREDDENAMCGKCHHDDWIEWRDFTDKNYPYIKRVLHNYIKSTNSKSLGEFLKKVIISDRISYKTAIKDIFEKGIYISKN